MHFYVNANQPGDVVELDERSPRLDRLDNWAHYTTREAAESGRADGKGTLVVRDGVLSREGMTAVAPTIAPRTRSGRGPARPADSVEPVDVEGLGIGDPTVPAPPAEDTPRKSARHTA